MQLENVQQKVENRSLNVKYCIITIYALDGSIQRLVQENNNDKLGQHFYITSKNI